MKLPSRELRVGLLAVLAIFLLYFGFNFLKGINVFDSTRTYYVQYSDLGGLTEQSPVYICGFKVGQVDVIRYDFSAEQAFTVAFSIPKDIIVPHGSEVVLRADGLISGMALDVQISPADTELYAHGDTLPSSIEPSLMESLKEGLLADVGELAQRMDSLVALLQDQLSEGKIKSTLANLEMLTADLQSSSAQLKQLMNDKVPSIIDNVDTTMYDIRLFAHSIRDIDLKNTVTKADSVLDNVNSIAQLLRSEDGTVGMLLNNKDLYISLNNTVQSADSLLVDLKANPKRYVHFSVFGKKEKK